MHVEIGEEVLGDRLRSVRDRPCHDLAKLGVVWFVFFFQAEDGIRDLTVTGVQTCALPILTAVTGRWVRGARELQPGTHPFRKPFGQLAIGDTFNSAEREVTLEDIERFADL